MAKILCEVTGGGEELSLLCLQAQRQRNPFPFKLFECIHGEKGDKIRAAVLQGIYRLRPVEAINTAPFLSVRKSLSAKDQDVSSVFWYLTCIYKVLNPYPS